MCVQRTIRLTAPTSYEVRFLGRGLAPHLVLPPKGASPTGHPRRPHEAPKHPNSSGRMVSSPRNFGALHGAYAPLPRGRGRRAESGGGARLTAPLLKG